MGKRLIVKIGLLVVAIVLVASLVSFVPAKVSVTGEGNLSLESRVALAVNNPPTSDITEQRYQAGDEVIEKRTRNSKTHWLGGNSYSWDGTIGSVHYWEDEQWKEIDNAFEPTLAPWNWEMLKAGYHIRVKEDFTAGQIIEFEKQGETVQFQPMALEWTNHLDQIQPIAMPRGVTPAITNPEVDLLPAVGMPSHQGTIRWDNAYGEGLDFEWRCTSTRLVKILEIENLKKLPVPEQYILDGGRPALRLNLIFDPSSGVGIYVGGELWDKKTKWQTFRTIEFHKGGEVLWGFMPLKYWGSNLELEENEGQSVATLEKRGNKLYISIRVPYEWLQSAIYPVFVDTDIDEVVTDSGDDGRCKRPIGTFETAVTSSPVGSYSDTLWYDAFYRFTEITIPAGATVDGDGLTSYVELYYGGSEGSPETDIYLQNDADPAAPTSEAELDADYAARGTGIPWDASGVAGYDPSPELKTIFQELIDAQGGLSNAAVLVLHWHGIETGNNRQIWWHYDYNGGIRTPKLHIEYTAGEADISNLPTSKAFGNVSESSSYWSNGSAPTFPLDDGECYFTVTNNGVQCSITIKATNFIGGDGWTLTSGNPGSGTVRMRAGKSGDANEDAMVILTTGEQPFIAGLVASKKWELKLETGIFTDPELKTSVITLAATLD